MNLKATMVALAALLCAGEAQAEFNAAAHPSLRFMLTAGITHGGDKVGTLIDIESGRQSYIRAGKRLYGGAGAYWRSKDSPFSAQLTIAQHMDDSRSKSGFNHGRVSFKRVPVELLGHYHFADKWAVGGGIRYAMNAQWEGNSAGEPRMRQDLDSKVGWVLDAQYEVVPDLLLGLRFVGEEYEATLASGKTMTFSGNHGGVSISYLF